MSSVITISDSDSEDIGEKIKSVEVKQEYHGNADEDSSVRAAGKIIKEDEVLKLFGKESGKTALEILLRFNSSYESKVKPYGIRKNYCCTLRHDAVSVESCKADGNGAYLRTSGYKTLYKIDYSDGNEIIGVQTCHKEETPDGIKIYFNKRVARDYEKVYVSHENVFEVERIYRYSKWNESFVHLIIIVKKFMHLKNMTHYITAYKNDLPEEQFVMSRHGNSSKATAPEYHRTDKKTLQSIKDDILRDKPIAKIYEERDDTQAADFSQCVKNPKQIYNIKMRSVDISHDECIPSSSDDLIKQIKWSNGAYMQSLTFIKDHYFHVNYNRKSLNDIKKVCSEDFSVLRFDTTFEIVNGFWLTDTSYSNLALLDSISGKNPEFPGPNMIHFRKDRETYRRFAGEMLMAEPDLYNIKQIGTDLDPAVYKGVGDVFQNAARRKCVQHIMERDSFKLNKMGATDVQKKRILSDIYGSEEEQIFNVGLTDADSEADFEVKFQSLEDIWESLVPGFYLWFRNKRVPLFLISVINADLDRAQVGNRFYNNRLELLHKLQKKYVSEGDCKNDICSINKALEKWSETFIKEEAKAIYGQGKYRLAPGYDKFYVEPAKWFKWSQERKDNHTQAFLSFVPNVSDTYKKPKNAGLKGDVNEKKRRNGKEPVLFIDQFENEELDLLFDSNKQPKVPKIAESQEKARPTATSILVDVSKKVDVAAQMLPLETCNSQNTNNLKEQRNVEENTEANPLFDPLDPDRKVCRMYYLVHRKDKKNCPAKVSRCNSCKLRFQNHDVVLVRTQGTREWTDKDGTKKTSSGNIYLHYLSKCLEGEDGEFRFEKITVLKETLKLLPASAAERFRKRKRKFE